MLELFDLLNNKSAIILSDLFNLPQIHESKVSEIFKNAKSKDQVIVDLIYVTNRSENFRDEMVKKLKLYVKSRTNHITEPYFKDLVNIDDEFFKMINDERKIICILGNNLLLPLASSIVIDKLLLENNTSIHYKIYKKIESEKNLAYACVYFIDKMSEENLLSLFTLIFSGQQTHTDILPTLKIALGRGFMKLTDYFIDLLENGVVYIFHPIKNEILLTAIEENKYKIIKWHCEHGFVDGIWSGISMAAKLKNRKILNLLMAYVS